MDRITDKQLQAVVDRINRTTGSPLATYTRDADGGLRSNVGNYHLDFAYGGVTLYRIANEAGGCSNVLRIGHVPKRELLNQMHAFITGIETAQAFPNQRAR